MHHRDIVELLTLFNESFVWHQTVVSGCGFQGVLQITVPTARESRMCAVCRRGRVRQTLEHILNYLTEYLEILKTLKGEQILIDGPKI